MSEPTARERWEAQEHRRLAALVGDRYAEEFVSILREHVIPGTVDAVPVRDALHLIMDVWRIAGGPEPVPALSDDDSEAQAAASERIAQFSPDARTDVYGIADPEID